MKSSPTSSYSDSSESDHSVNVFCLTAGKGRSNSSSNWKSSSSRTSPGCSLTFLDTLIDDCLERPIGFSSVVTSYPPFDEHTDDCLSLPRRFTYRSKCKYNTKLFPEKNKCSHLFPFFFSCFWGTSLYRFVGRDFIK